MDNFKRTLVTCALPYANGPVHIGHLAGVYVPADIYVRYLRMRGREVLFICGSDEHGVPITIKARQLGCSPQDIVDKYHAVIKKSFEDFGMSFDIYSRTSSKIHGETASAFFLKMYNDGKFIEKESEQYYDTEAKAFLADRYIVGTCPKCGFEGAYGDQCEKCGSTLSPDELINPHSAISGSKPVKRKTKHWYLPLDQYEPWLRKWILEDHKEWKSNVYGQCKSWLDNHLQPRAVTRDLEWGVPVPLKGAEGKVLYVWFDAPIGYISNTRELLPNDWEKWWKSPDTRLINFIGKDNIVFHCIVFPAMLKGYGDGYILPDNVPANEFLNLEGNKISTSRNWAVWLDEYLKDFPGKQDVLRYVLCANAPETQDNDFTWKNFQTRNNSELVAILGNFINRVAVLTGKYFEGKVPCNLKPEKIDSDTLAHIPQIRGEVENSLEHFRFRDALTAALSMARLGNKYLTDTEPWKCAKNDMDRTASILYTALQISADLSIVFAPFLPFTVVKLDKILNTAPLGWDRMDGTGILPAGHQLGEPELLFEKIEDDAIQMQMDKLASAKEANEKRAKEEIEKRPLAAKPECTFEEFQKMDIRIATVIKAEKVPDTDKLLKLTIDTGLDERVIVSGIAGSYPPEQMTGKQICILANLKPRVIRGIESNGMILMAQQPDGTMRIVEPDGNLMNGSQVG
jgi:methionyl-tRNA synthetase